MPLETRPDVTLPPPPLVFASWASDIRAGVTSGNNRRKAKDQVMRKKKEKLKGERAKFKVEFSGYRNVNPINIFALCQRLHAVEMISFLGSEMFWFGFDSNARVDTVM